MRRWRKVVAGLAIGWVALLLLIEGLAGPVVKAVVNRAGRQRRGVPVSVQGVRISLVRGRIALDSLVVGNPEDVQAATSFRLQRAVVEVRLASLFTPVIRFRRIALNSPVLTYRIELKRRPPGARATASAPDQAVAVRAKPAKRERGVQKVQIDDLAIENGQVELGLLGLGIPALPVPLQPVHLSGIGRDSNGVAPKEVLALVLGALGGGLPVADVVGEGVQR